MTLIERQYGVIARWQLRSWLRESQIDGHVHRGQLIRLERGAYRVAGGAALPVQRPLAAALRVGSASLLTGPFVLGHLGVDGFEPRDPFEVLIPPGRRLAAVRFPVRRCRDLDHRGALRVGDIRLAGPLDALIDSGRFRDRLGDRRLRLAYDWLRWRGRVDSERARRRIIEVAATDAGARALLAAFGDEGEVAMVSESDGERTLGGTLLRFDPQPEPQVWVTPHHRCDYYFRGLRLGYEYLGTVDHATLLGRVRDAARDEELRRQGIVLQFVRAQDLAESQALLGSIASALTVRAHQLGVRAPVLRGPAERPREHPPTAHNPRV